VYSFYTYFTFTTADSWEIARFFARLSATFTALLIESSDSADFNLETSDNYFIWDAYYLSYFKSLIPPFGV